MPYIINNPIYLALQSIKLEIIMLGILSFVGFTLLVALIAYLATRKTDESSSDGYFLGGRSLTAGV
ncbi:MAG TPA: hypothetical protein DIT95_14795, partial [Arenibacter sp.]|nr:hypothetical protein [Arenibacter sp.]